MDHSDKTVRGYDYYVKENEGYKMGTSGVQNDSKMGTKSIHHSNNSLSRYISNLNTGVFSSYSNNFIFFNIRLAVLLSFTSSTLHIDFHPLHWSLVTVPPPIIP